MATAQFELARMYEEGLGVPRDDQEAARRYETLAQQGNVAALRRLARLYADGRGGSQDRALMFYRRLAERGDAPAQHELANRLADETSIAPDAVEAAMWYQRAADQGLAAAQYALGGLYEDGRGVRKDPFSLSPFNPCVRFSRTRLTDDLLDMCREAEAGHAR